MEIQIELEKNDWKKYLRYIEKELPRRQKTWMDSFWVNMLGWMLIGFVFMGIYSQFSIFHLPTAISMMIFFILILIMLFFKALKIRRAFEPSEEGAFCGKHHFKFTEQGIESGSDGYAGRYSWETVKKVERVQGMILLYIDTADAFVFPESKLSDPDSLYRYISDQYFKYEKSS